MIEEPILIMTWILCIVFLFMSIAMLISNNRELRKIEEMRRKWEPYYRKKE